MFELKESIWELVARSAVLYVFIFILFRVKNRDGGELSPADQVVLIVIGNLVASAAIKSDDSVPAAIVAIGTFAILSAGVTYVVFKSKSARKILEGEPKILVHNGKMLESVMARERINADEIMEAIRGAGLASLADVHIVVSETNGVLSVVPKSDKKS